MFFGWRLAPASLGRIVSEHESDPIEPRSEATVILIERAGPDVGRRHPLGLGSHVIGRGEAAQVELRDSDVSRRHARIEVADDRVIVEDLGSKNGVLVDDRPIRAATRLGHGERFEVGGVVLEVSHPGARVGKLLAAGGEAVMRTKTSYRGQRQDRPRSMLLPLLGVVVFGALVVALLVWG